MYFNLEQQHILFSLFYLYVEHGDLQKIMGVVFMGTHELKPNSFVYFHEKGSGHFVFLTSMSEFVVKTAPWASATSDSFAALIGYWTLKHANILAHKQLLKGSIESMLSCWHIASVLRAFCGFLLLKETDTDCSKMTLRWATCQTPYQLSLTHALSALYLGTDFSSLIEQQILI